MENNPVSEAIQPTTIVLKGIRDGILISLKNNQTWIQANKELICYIDQQKEFLKGARIVLNVGNFTLKAVELSQLRKSLSEMDLFLWAILSTSQTTIDTARTLGLDTEFDTPKRSPSGFESIAGIAGAEEAVFLCKTLRSGNRVEYHGNVVVLGDVNPGAEIIAGGNIIVWGKLNGLVHAGVDGDETAVVCALDLEPTQLRIADFIAVTPKRRGKAQPEIARLDSNKVIAEIWKPKKKK